MILKHRDTEVLRFVWLEPDGVRVTSVNEKALRFLPLEMHGEPTDGRLLSWLRLKGFRFKRKIQRLIAELKSQGRLERVGTGRVKSWKVVNGGMK